MNNKKKMIRDMYDNVINKITIEKFERKKRSCFFYNQISCCCIPIDISVFYFTILSIVII